MCSVVYVMCNTVLNDEYVHMQCTYIYTCMYICMVWPGICKWRTQDSAYCLFRTTSLNLSVSSAMCMKHKYCHKSCLHNFVVETNPIKMHAYHKSNFNQFSIFNKGKLELKYLLYQSICLFTESLENFFTISVM